MSTLYLDLETYCDEPLASGTHKYAERVEVMLVAVAVDDGPVHVADLTRNEPFDGTFAAVDTVVIHNSAFDRTMLRHALGIDIPAEVIVDTYAQALAHSLPGSLAELCAVLRIGEEQAKDAAGKGLIQLFCKPQPANRTLRRATRETHPAEWAQFVEYARLDVAAMREVYRKLPRWNYPTTDRDVWVLDQKINDRGIAIDLELVDAAIAATNTRKAELADEVAEATGGALASANQRAKFLAHLLEAYGVTLPDLTASTIERRLDDPALPQPVRDLLLVRLAASTTSVSKYTKLRAAVSSDARLRGTLQYCGASRTGRWAGRVFQPHNLPRPTMKAKAVAGGIAALKAGVAHITDDVMALASSAIRGVIVAPAGRHLLVADLANIEGRALAWLAGEEWKLEAFREFDAGRGPDLYRLAYARGFNMQPDHVTDDQRQIGKVQELALGYQGGPGAFGTMAEAYGLELPEATVRELVRAWRAANRAIVAFWYALDRAARDAIARPGVAVDVGPVTFEKINSWLRVRLPSGRFLCYPAPAVAEITCKNCGGKGHEEHAATADKPAEVGECFRCEGAGVVVALTYYGVDQYSRKWARQDTYGGKLAENITQAFSRDVLAAAMLRAEADGLAIVLTVHDEIIAEAATTRAVGELCAHMTAPLPWAPGLPLAAKGFAALRYGKE